MIRLFETSELLYASSNFPAYNDLLVMLYESYAQAGEEESSLHVNNLLKQQHKELANDLMLSRSIFTGDEKTINALASVDKDREYIHTLMNNFNSNKKSITKAQLLSTFIPGSGYLYIGQKKAAMTSFLLNGLFIAAATQFFMNEYYVAGAFTLALETGWYIGGIYGAGESAKAYNDTHYSMYGHKILSQEKLYPILKLDYAFSLIISLFLFSSLYAEWGSWGVDAELTQVQESQQKKTSTSASIGIGLLRFYQKVISPANCRKSHYLPTSSQYAVEAIQQNGFLKGWVMACDRLMRENDEEWVYDTIVINNQCYKWDPINK